MCPCIFYTSVSPSSEGEIFNTSKIMNMRVWTYNLTSTVFEWQQKGQSNTFSTFGGGAFMILIYSFFFPCFLFLLYNYIDKDEA